MSKPTDFTAEYTAAHYYVCEPAQTLRVGAKHPWLDALLTQQGHRCWAFLSAENPLSTPLNRAQNTQRTQQLATDLQATGLPTFAAEGQDPTGEWPAEQSFLVLGLDTKKAQRLALKYQQNAYLGGQIQQEAQLIWTEFTST